MAAVITAVLLAPAGLAGPADQQARLDDLFDQLGQKGLPNWKVVEDEIWLEWSRAGSPTVSFLLERGRKAMKDGDFRRAIEHLTALTDHAPDFAEGFNARATAYFRAGLFGPSLADVQRTLALNPRHFGALAGLGTMLEEMDQPQRALDAFRAALTLNPNNPDLIQAVERLQTRTQGTTL